MVLGGAEIGQSSGPTDEREPPATPRRSSPMRCGPVCRRSERPRFSSHLSRLPTFQWSVDVTTFQAPQSPDPTTTPMLWTLDFERAAPGLCVTHACDGRSIARVALTPAQLSSIQKAVATLTQAETNRTPTREAQRTLGRLLFDLLDGPDRTASQLIEDAAKAGSRPADRRAVP